VAAEVAWTGLFALRGFVSAWSAFTTGVSPKSMSFCCVALKSIAILLATSLVTGCATNSTASKSGTEYVNTKGQPEPVPAEWLATTEGKFAHSIQLPQPLPRDSGYRRGMTSEQYFDHLCKSEAGDFIYKTVEAVDGFYFARPPTRPTDDDLQDRYKLEAPEIERTYQLMPGTPAARATAFIAPPSRLFQFIEEPNRTDSQGTPYVRAFGYVLDKSRTQVEPVSELRSRYGLIWRGIKRPKDRELAIAGSEWIVFDLQTNEVLAVRRDYARSGFSRNTPDGIWWLNAVHCPNVKFERIFTDRFYQFVTKSLRPVGDK
jgi:hypothetical protein